MIDEVGLPVAVWPNSVDQVADVTTTFETTGSVVVNVEIKGFYEVRGEPRRAITDGVIRYKENPDPVAS